MSEVERNASTAQVVVVGLSHKTAPVELRERYALTEDDTRQTLKRLRADDAVEEALIVSTCNRTEYYAVSGKPERALDVLRQAFYQRHRDANAERMFFEHAQPDSIRHLAAVASSLDSMVIGEAQILGQVKRAYEIAIEEDALGKHLHALLQRTLNVAKTIRTVTEIAQRPVSVSSIAVEMAQRVLGELTSSKILLIGAGKMPELCLRHLQRAGAESVTITNRTASRAEEMARRWDAKTSPFDALDDSLVDADIVISSTAAQHTILTFDIMKRVMARRHHRPLLVIDIALPRDAEPTVNDLENLYLFDIDGLQEVAGLNQEAREAEVQRCLKLIADEMALFERWQNQIGVEPTIKELSEKLREVGRQELERMRPKVADGADAKLMEQLVHRLVGKFLNFEIRHIRAGMEEEDAHRQLELARQAYELSLEDDL